MEDIEGPDTAGDDFRGLGEALGSFRIFFKKSDNRIDGKEYCLWGQFWLQDPPNYFLLDPKSVNSYLFNPWDKTMYSKKL